MNIRTKLIVSAAAIACIFFYAGIKYNEAHAAPTRASAFQAARGVTGGRAGSARGGLTVGTIASRDAQSITLSIPGGGSKIVFVATSTTITRSVSASPDDLKVGGSVIVTGAANSDGSLTASSIDLRPLPPQAVN